MIITIDGPTASGKSTVARIVAKQLNFYYLYSGLLFRALAYIMIRDKGYAPEMKVPFVQAHVDSILDPRFFEYRYEDGREYVFCAQQNITPFLKASTIDQAASKISTDSYVRHQILLFQRYLAQHHHVVVDGRDAGSVVFPKAEYKFFITASLVERAQRWRLDQEKTGASFTQHEAEILLKERDMRDSERAEAPLTVPEGAFIIDTTMMDQEMVVNTIIQAIKIPEDRF